MNTFATLTDTRLPFPPRNDAVRAIWAAIYLEPMVGSGERICIAVAVANESASLVVPVVALSRLNCIYGEEHQAIIVASNFVVKNLTSTLNGAGMQALYDWVPPMAGVLMGRIADGAGVTLEAIARSALSMSSSLVENLCESDRDNDGSSDGMSSNRLLELVKERVTSERPNLGPLFGIKRRLGENMRAVNFGFVGNTIVANFGVLVPPYLNANVKDIKAKLWDLAQVREDFGRQALLPSTISRYEMLIYRPREDAPEYSTKQMTNIQEAVYELEVEADKQDLRSIAHTGHEQIAARILEAEAY